MTTLLLRKRVSGIVERLRQERERLVLPVANPKGVKTPRRTGNRSCSNSSVSRLKRHWSARLDRLYDSRRDLKTRRRSSSATRLGRLVSFERLFPVNRNLDSRKGKEEEKKKKKERKRCTGTTRVPMYHTHNLLGSGNVKYLGRFISEPSR